MSMNIYAESGSKVKASFDNEGKLMHGHDYQREEASKYLEMDKIYTVDHTEVHSWYTDVYLVEFPNVKFNSVHFEDYIPEDKEPSFSLEDMVKCWNEGCIAGIDYCNGIETQGRFSKFMNENYNIFDII